MTDEILDAIRSAPREALPAVLAECFTRLLTPVPAPAAKPLAIDEWLDVPAACEFLKCSKSFLYHARAGVNPRRAGRKLLFSRRELETYLNQGER